MPSVILFSLVAVALVGVALAFVLPTLLRPRERRDEAVRTAIHADIYRRDLEERQDEVKRDELPAAELAPAREELQRRLLDGTRNGPAAPVGWARRRLVAWVIAAALPLLAAGLYFAVGMPSALNEAEVAAPANDGRGDYIARLQTHLGRQPRDARGWVLLARAQAERDQFQQAASSSEQALAVSSKVAKDPGVLTEYADVLGMTQGGRLAGKPAELIAKALAIDPRHPAALEMAGSAAYAEGRYADSVRYWERLLAELPAGSTRHTELSAAIARAQQRAAVTLPDQQ